MTPEQAEDWDRAKQLFAAPLEKAPAARAEFLAEACGNDRELRSEVQTLLSAHDQAGDFLESRGGLAHAERNRLVAGARIGPYEIVALIGAGGMGEVYRARDTRLGREVAIKVLPAGAQYEMGLRRFEQEARAAGSLNHPNILAVHDVGSHEGAPYIVSELLHGETLRERLTGKPLPLRKVIDLALQLAQGLSAAHDKGVIHRDLKPENLFITDEGRLKILDFGIAKLVHEGEAPKGKPVTQAGAVMGTVGYMSPEQVRGEPADHCGDIFAFGAILSERLTGKLAFDRPTPVETGNAILNDEPRELPESVPVELDRIVRRCLEKKPQERFQSAHDLAFQLASVPATTTGPRPDSLIGELQRRRVFRALVGYGIAAFAVLQIVEPVMHGLHWPDAVLSYVVVALAVGFPVVISLAWIFDVNAGRIERTVTATEGLTGTRLALVLVGIGLLAASPGVVWYFFLRAGAHLSFASSDEAFKAKSNAVPPASDVRAPPSVAVLPFVDMSETKDQEYFSDGLSEELIDLLTKIPELRVPPRTSSFYFKGKQSPIADIAKALGVTHLLEGSVRKSGNTLRVTAQLIRIDSGYNIWSEIYDSKLGDVFKLQNEIAGAVVKALKVSLLADGLPATAGTQSVEANDLYLRASFLYFQGSESGTARAVELLTRAVALDPAFAKAWAQLSRAKLLQARLKLIPAAQMESARLEGRRAAEKAVALDPNLAETHIALGRVYEWPDYDVSKAAAEFRRALEINPRSADAINHFASTVARKGRIDEQIRLLQQALAIDPLNVNIMQVLGQALLANGDPAAAEGIFRKELELAPTSMFVNAGLGRALMMLDRPAEALEFLKRDARTDAERQWVRVLECVFLGRTGEADALLASLETNPGSLDPVDIAQLHAFRGNKDRAFDWLERQYRADSEELTSWILYDPFLRPLRDDPRFKAMLRKLKLAEQQ